MKRLFLVCTAAVLIGCHYEPPKPYKVEVREYTIIDYSRPKHVYVDLRDNVSGEVFKRVYVSKHFNAHREKLAPGRVIRLTRGHFRQGGTDTSKFININEELHK